MRVLASLLLLPLLLAPTVDAITEPISPPSATPTPPPPAKRGTGQVISVDLASPLCLDAECTLPVVWQGWMTNAPGWLNSTGKLPPYPGDRPTWWQPFMDLVDDIGVNRIAFGVRAGIQSPTDYWAAYVAGVPTPTPPPPLRSWNWDYHRDAPFQWTILDKAVENFLLPMRDRLATHGEPLFWNFEYYNSSGGQFTVFRDDPDQFADWVWAIWGHVNAKYGLTPDGFSLNEPSTTGDNWTMAQVGAAFKAIATRLAGSGWHPRFEGPASEHVSAAAHPNAQSDFDDLIAQPGVSTYLTDIEYHLYGGFVLSDLTAIIDRAVRYKKRVGMSEHLDARHHELDTLLRLGKISYFRQLGLGGRRCLPPPAALGPGSPPPTPCNPDELGSLILIDASQNNETFIQSEAWYLRQYMKFIHMNARAVTATSTDIDSMRPAAFVNPNGAPVVVIDVFSVSSGGSFAVAGLPPGTYNIKYTVDGDRDHDLPAQSIASGGLIETSIPAVGVITIYRDDTLIPTFTPAATGRATVTPTRATTTATKPTQTPPATTTRNPTDTRTPVRTVTHTPEPSPTLSSQQALLASVISGIFTGVGPDVNADGRLTAADIPCAVLAGGCVSGAA